MMCMINGREFSVSELSSGAESRPSILMGRGHEKGHLVNNCWHPSSFALTTSIRIDTFRPQDVISKLLG